MTRMMLDTNICIYIIKNRPPSVKRKFESLEIGELCLSSITVSELYYGAYKSQHQAKNLKALKYFLMPFEILEYDYNAAVAYGRIRAELEKKGKVIGNMDMQIAGHALSRQMTLVTNNTKEFERISGLMLDNWL